MPDYPRISSLPSQAGPLPPAQESEALPEVCIHSSAVVETQDIGGGTDIGPFVHVMPGAVIGRNCNICAHATLDANCVLEEGVTVMNGAYIAEGVRLGKGVFVGPGAVFTNDLLPRSPRAERFAHRYERQETWLVTTDVGEHASIGANATVVCGNPIGRYALVAAGAVVTRPVAELSLVKGVPARFSHWIDEEGRPVEPPPDQAAPKALATPGQRFENRYR